MTGEKPAKSARTRRKRGVRLTRDGVIFVVGLLGIIHQTLVVEADRPTLLLLFGAMIGLPAFLRLDDRKNKDE